MSTSQSDHLRRWVLAGRALFIAVVLVAVVGAIAGYEIWLVVLVGVVVGLGGGWLLDPRRSWWGPEPFAVLSDPDRLRAWRRAEIRFAVMAFIVIAIAVPVALAVIAELGN